MYRRLRHYSLAAFAGVAVMCLAGAPVRALPGPLVHQSQTQAELDASFIEAWKQQPRATLNVPATGATLVVVKFNDWMCPGCRATAEIFKPILARYAAMRGALQDVEKDWPWNTRCNAAASVTFAGHEASCEAAAAVRLAADRGQRDAMAAWLFANQPETDAARKIMPERVRAKAAELLAVKDFDAAYALKLPDIRRDVTEGQALLIRSTPTYFINGVRAVGADEATIPAHYFEVALKYEFEKK